jgi:DNA polymerase III subunit delta'
MSWSRIRGHEHLIDAFTRAVARKRLAHAFLFVGPRGVGKGLFARELARALLCEAPPAHTILTACDRCDSCLLVSAGTHPDLFCVQRPDDKNEFPIDLMRELCAGFSLKTARGHGKIGIVEDVDDLNDAAANCFLKTLEEPPPRSVFILVGTDLGLQMATIQSRCQIVRFGALPESAVRDALRAQGITEVGKLDRLVRLSAGSPGQALALADDALWECRRVLLAGLTERRPDPMAMAHGFIEFAEDAGKDGALQRRRASLVLRLLIEALNDALNICVDAPVRSCGPDEEALLRVLAERASPETFIAMIERCLEAEVQLDRYIQLAVVSEGLMDALVQTMRGAMSATAAS